MSSYISNSPDINKYTKLTRKTVFVFVSKVFAICIIVVISDHMNLLSADSISNLIYTSLPVRHYIALLSYLKKKIIFE